MLSRFAIKCLNLEQTKELFPLNNITHSMNLRNKEKYKVTHANTNRLMNSTVPYIQRLLNRQEHENKNKKK